jgi:hypothetical protein
MIKVTPKNSITIDLIFDGNKINEKIKPIKVLKSLSK